MISAIAILAAVLGFALYRVVRLQRDLALRDGELANAKTEVLRIQASSEAAVQEVHKMVNDQLSSLRLERERIRAHYEAEARQARADATPQPQGLVDPQRDANRLLSEALAEATSLRTEAAALLELARAATLTERPRPSALPKES
jgi:hypothetical protein